MQTKNLIIESFVKCQSVNLNDYHQMTSCHPPQVDYVNPLTKNRQKKLHHLVSSRHIMNQPKAHPLKFFDEDMKDVAD